MSDTIPTPRTDAAFEGDLSVGVPPEMKTWKEAADFARAIERELSVAEEALKNIAVANLGKGWADGTLRRLASMRKETER